MADLRSVVLGLVAVTALASGCKEGDPTPGILVSEAWVRPALVPLGADSSDPSGAEPGRRPGGGGEPSGSARSFSRSAGYLVIENQGSADDRLLAVEASVASSVEVHRTVLSGDVASMQPVVDIPLPAGASVRLEPGGLHLMLLGLTRTLEVGDTVILVLRFQTAPPATVASVVQFDAGG